MKIISFDNVCVSRRGKRILDDISFEVSGGERIGLTGPSGSGKSTILMALMGAFPVNDGVILFNGQPIVAETIRQARKEVAFIGQEPSLCAETVEAALRLPFLFRANRRHEPDKGRLMSVLEQVGLDGQILGQRVATVSGGEKQRIAIARALLMNKNVFLCDEITSALDPASRDAVLRIFSDSTYTVLSVSHDPQWLAQCDRLLEVRGGRLINPDLRKTDGNN